MRILNSNNYLEYYSAVDHENLLLGFNCFTFRTKYAYVGPRIEEGMYVQFHILRRLFSWCISKKTFLK